MNNIDLQLKKDIESLPADFWDFKDATCHSKNIDARHFLHRK